ncbi:MAG: PAS domain S-box protein [Nitrospiraceae bacterium]|nr:PAS domain S-box protein [Nitrospiraceae bacterium]
MMDHPSTVGDRWAFTPSIRLGYAAIIALIAAIFLLDGFTPLGIPIWVLYLVPLALASRRGADSNTYVVAGTCAFLTALGFVISPQIGGVPLWVPIINRALFSLLLPLLAFLITRHQKLTQELIAHAALQVEHRALQAQESALQKAAADIQDLYDHAPCGYHSLDAQTKIISINQTELDWLGYSREELVGKICFLDLVTPASARIIQQRFPRFIEDGLIQDVELELVRKNGTILPVLLSGTAIKNSEGRFIASRSILIDNTARRAAETVLRRSHEALEATVAERAAELVTVNDRLETELRQGRAMAEILRVSEARFRELVESLPQLIWTAQSDGLCDYLSPQWIRYTGLAATGLLGSGLTDAVHPDDRRTVSESWAAAVARGKPFEGECRLRGADGCYRWFHTKAVPLHDGTGSVAKWLGSSTDIDDRKRGEANQARLAAIVESSSDAIISTTLDDHILTWNQAAERMFGYRTEEVLGRSASVIVPAQHRDHITTVIEQVKMGAQISQLETQRQRRDGEGLEVSLAISPIKDADGRLLGISTIARDITERKRTERELTQLRRLIELSHDPIFAWDLHQGIVEWNRGCELLYGYSKAEAVGCPSPVLLRSIFPQPLDEIVATMERTGEWTGEIRQRTKDGREVIVESRLSLRHTDDRSLILETSRDITEQRQAELTILRKNKDLETLLFVTSHDLKEPLRAIESFSLLLEERYADRLDDKGRDFLRRTIRATQRLDQLLTDILNLSRAQRMDVPAQDVEAEALVKEVLRQLEPRIKETRARIVIRSPLPRLRVNPTWATQGLYNLIANALKFSRPGESPDIEIAAYESEGNAEEKMRGLVVSDRGPGIPSEHRERIFQLFARIVGREVEGTGAGLAIVRQVAERHGGRAWVEDRQGGGSNFIMTFAQSNPESETLRQAEAAG